MDRTSKTCKYFMNQR